MASRSISSRYSQIASHASLSATFLRQGHQRHFHITPPPVLDFLAPSIAPSSFIQLWSGVPKHPKSRLHKTRGFTSTSKAARIINPRKDESGDVMSVELTPRASNRLKEIMKKDSNPNLALRVTVSSGGCHGLQYLLSIVTLPPLGEITSASPSTNSLDSPPPPEISGKEETLAEDDIIFIEDGAMVVIDEPSLDLLKGSKIDYTMELIGSQFIVNNPKATSSCGCGTSFDIKL